MSLGCSVGGGNYEEANEMPGGEVEFGEEVLFAMEAAHFPSLKLVGACVPDGATLPSYALFFKGKERPVCVTRPWRVATWMVDEEGECDCSVWNKSQHHIPNIKRAPET